MSDHMTEMYAEATALADNDNPDKREAWRLSLLIAALSNIMSYDTDPILRAACRARYLDLTDGRAPQ